jgi:hypothetical protein
VPRPKEGAEEEQFNLAWLKVNGHVKSGKVAKGAPAPPRIFFAAASSAAAAAAQAGGDEPQAARPAEEGKRQEGKRPEAPKAAAAGLAPLAIGSPPQLRQQRQRSPSPQRAVSPELMEDLAPYDGDPGGSSEDAESIPEMVRPSHIVLPLPVGPERNREGRKMPDAVRGAFPTPARLCRTCLVPAPDPHRMEWICECGLRGDKEAGEACNRLLAARMERQAAARRDPGDLPSSSGANAGQSYAQSTAASRLERELKHLARVEASGARHPAPVIRWSGRLRACVGARSPGDCSQSAGRVGYGEPERGVRGAHQLRPPHAPRILRPPPPLEGWFVGLIAPAGGRG